MSGAYSNLFIKVFTLNLYAVYRDRHIMGIDIAICIIVFISAMFYAHIGFARTVISAVQWVLCIACGIFFADDIKKFVYDVGIGKNMEASIANILSDKASESGFMKSLPGLFKGWANSAADSASKEMASTFTGLILTVLAFLVIVLAVKLILFIITRLLSKEYHDGPLAFIDSAAGLVLGAALGVLYVFIALAILVLVMHWLPESSADAVRDYMDSSYFSGILYDNNPLLTLIHMDW